MTVVATQTGDDYLYEVPKSLSWFLVVVHVISLCFGDCLEYDWYVKDCSPVEQHAFAFLEQLKRFRVLYQSDG